MNRELAPKQNLSLRDWVETDNVKLSLAKVLPDKRIISQFLMLARMSFAKTPALAACTKESVLQCLMQCGQFGLLPDGRHAHLIPYGDKCTMIIDYKGLVALASRNGITGIFAEVVYENDDFKVGVRNGQKELVHNYDAASDRGRPILFYSCATIGGVFDYEVMTLAEVEAIKNRSRAGKSGPWVTDFLEMGKKSVIRRQSKRWDITPELAAAIAADDDQVESEQDRFSRAKPVSARFGDDAGASQEKNTEGEQGDGGNKHTTQPEDHAPASEPSDEPAPEVEAYRVQDWKDFTGEKNGKAWKRTVFFLKDGAGNELEAATFSQTVADDVVAASNAGPVRLNLAKNAKGRGYDIVEVVK